MLLNRSSRYRCRVRSASLPGLFKWVLLRRSIPSGRGATRKTEESSLEPSDDPSDELVCLASLFLSDRFFSSFSSWSSLIQGRTQPGRGAFAFQGSFHNPCDPKKIRTHLFHLISSSSWPAATSACPPHSNLHPFPGPVRHQQGSLPVPAGGQ